MQNARNPESGLSTDPTTQIIRVGFVITELDVGGAEKCLCNLALGLDRERFLPEVYALAKRPAPGKDDLVRQLENSDIPVHFVGATSSKQFFAAIRRLKTLLERQSPHIVQSMLFHANVVGCRAAKRAKVPAIVTGVRVADPSKCRQRVERWLTRPADKIICVSDSVTDFCRKEAGFPDAKLLTISNGIDTQGFSNVTPADLAEFGIGGNDRVMLFVGRLVPQKGVDWLIETISPVLDRFPDYHLLLVGDGNERMKLENRVEQLGLASKVHFAGQRNDVPSLMKRSQVFVLPSRWEGMPNVVIEAMGLGLPVLSTTSHGVCEILGPLAEGQVFEFGDARGFVSKIGIIIEDNALSSELGAQNTQRIEEHFSLAKMISAYEQVYQTLCR